MKNFKVNIFLIIFLLICSTFTANALTERPEAPSISSIEPQEIFPGMIVKVSGYGMGDILKNRFIFSQNGHNFSGKVSGSTFIGTNLLTDWGFQIVQVPEEITAGNCQVWVEIEGRKSQPITVEVSQEAKAPVLTSVEPAFVNPGSTVTVNGSGFNDKDTLELTGADGKVYSQRADMYSTSGSIGFQVPEKPFSGKMTLKVIENRSGRRQASNILTFEIKKGAIPLTIYIDDSLSLAPGQWTEPATVNNDPLINATKIEYLLTQGGNKKSSFVNDLRKIHFQIPKSFTAGIMEVRTRTWTKDEVSPWSPPITLNVSESLRKPVIYSFEIIPSKAQALFIQGEKEIVLPLYLGAVPRSYIPETINNGSLKIFTSFWDDKKFTDWKLIGNYNSFSKTSRDFISQPEYEKRPQISLGPFFERININDTSPEFFEIKRGQNLRIYGDFFVESFKNLRVVLENSDKKIFLKSKEQEFDEMLLVEIPANLPGGDWKISVVNLSKKIETVVQTKLRIN